MTRAVWCLCPGLDKLLNGGFPKGRIILVTGRPSTGSVVSSLTQPSIRGAGLYVSLDESRCEFLKRRWTWSGTGQSGRLEKFVFLEVSALAGSLASLEANNFERKTEISQIAALLNMMVAASKIGASRIVVNLIIILILQLEGQVQQRNSSRTHGSALRSRSHMPYHGGSEAKIERKIETKSIFPMP